MSWQAKACHLCALADMLLPVQKAALGVFTKITQLQQEDLWFEFMDVLTGLLRPQQLEQVARSYCTSNAAVHRATKGDTIDPMEPFSRASAGELRSASQCVSVLYCSHGHAPECYC